jgi:putative membrane protein
MHGLRPPRAIRHMPDSIDIVLRRFIVTWFFNVVALWSAAELIDGIGYSGNEWVVVLAALVFSLVNIFVKPLVILFTLPLVILTLGLALFFVNLLMLYLTSWIVDDFKVESFGAAILATIIVWIVNTVLEAAFARVEPERERYAD